MKSCLQKKRLLLIQSSGHHFECRVHFRNRPLTTKKRTTSASNGRFSLYGIILKYLQLPQNYPHYFSVVLKINCPTVYLKLSIQIIGLTASKWFFKPTDNFNLLANISVSVGTGNSPESNSIRMRLHLPDPSRILKPYAVGKTNYAFSQYNSYTF